ncbi:M48 family metallopeptidase [Leadbettera azotonutricia]|uniref:Zinc metalloprotease n=1 Tax=Leadbettera azotonutricia (strain ATCC BAA-888 / DSM 13862 / ZAS-9) TaxID=545695 RepID=F5YEK8_LEAAZ|nr:SprT family zinc-dependent metalloprotease [Leadbettera azotonutricia]AEF80985.1 zinc metalloprotease [Leadbettera azotonutricia ZAS-9]
MAQGLTLGNIFIEVEYRRMKNMRITVYPPDGRVLAAVPLNTSAELIRGFVVSKLPWIEKHREKFRSNSKAAGSLKEGEKVYVWGKALDLEIVEKPGNPKITISDGCIKMKVRPGATTAKKQELLDKWYRNAVKEAAPLIIKKWEPLLKVEVLGLYVRKMKSHWGSCNSERQTLRLNSELAKKSPECFEYVILHEMIHIIEVGHNKRFYSYLNKFMPVWKTIRKKMNSGEL